MSIKRVHSFDNDAKLVSPEQISARVNFHHIFGTNNCLLKCEARKISQKLLAKSFDSRTARKVGKISRRKDKDFQEGGRDSFTQDELSKSAIMGCGSCMMLEKILAQAFHGIGQHEESRGLISCSYSVSSYFVLTETIEGEGRKETKEVQLFQLSGKSLK
jgi:cytochrome c peroxidase